MNPKICPSKQKQIEVWTQHYLQAKADGNTRNLKMYHDLILKLGGRIPK